MLLVLISDVNIVSSSDAKKKCHAAAAKKLGRRVKTPKNIVISKSFLTYHVFDRPFPPGSN